jgi:glycosyltransferase involved in cell wall biosynthesis
MATLIDPVEGPDAPDVSVIVAVYNTMPYLTKCLTSLVTQSIGHDRMEIIAVDDGSTDDSPRELARFAGKYPGVVRVLRQANSGGPAAPSNRALEIARGRYVFFTGSDDFLGAEALERMVAAGDEYDADLIAGRMVGIGGRFVPWKIFSETNTDVDLYNSDLPFAMSNTKLFRRSLLEAHGIRYPEDLRMGSDQPFTVAAAVHSKRIVVLSDYDYYFAVRRQNSSNITFTSSHEVRLQCTRRIMEETASLLDPGPRRDAILRRSFTSELSKITRPDFLSLDRPVQERLVAGIAELSDRYLTENIRIQLDAARRLRISLAQRGQLDDVLAVIKHHSDNQPSGFVRDDSGLYAEYPGFRDGRGIPDAWYFVTDQPVEMMAHQLAIVSIKWRLNATGMDVLTIKAASPFTDAELSAAGVSASIGGLPASVRFLTSEDDGQTTVVFEWTVRAMLTEVHRYGGRLDLLAEASDGTNRYRVPMKLPSALKRPKKLARSGLRGYVIRISRQPESEIAVDLRPATRGEVQTHLKRRFDRQFGKITDRAARALRLRKS